MKKKYLRDLGILLIALLLFAAPLLGYQIKFNGSFSDDHQVWAQFGDYISGIYAPILSVLTLLVLYIQVGIQKRMADTAEAQKYLDDTSADLEYQVLQMQAILLRKPLGERTIGSARDESLYRESDGDVLKTEGKYPALLDDSVEIVSVWGAIYTTLYGFKNRDHPMYELAFRRAIIRLQVSLTHQTCVALDEFHRENSYRKSPFEYVFLSM